MALGHHRRAAAGMGCRLALAVQDARSIRRSLLAAVLLAGCTSPTLPVETPAPAPEPRPANHAVATPPSSPTEPCPHVEGEDAKLFAYDAFGPAAMSYDLLGQAWWQWHGEGHAFEEAEGVVWVVVHDGVAPDALATRFPVRQAERCDHRYVTVDDAIAYLEDHIAELDGVDVPELAPVVERLRQTRISIVQLFRAP